MAVLTLVGLTPAHGDSPAARRRQQAREFHLRARQRTGVLVPLYVYPTNVHKNRTYNRLMELKRRYETVPLWVILNPASGPGKEADANYSRAIDRLRGAGCVVLGYVATGYGKRPEGQVRKDIDAWLRLYPHVHGIFFDEMRYEDNEAAVKWQAALNRYAHEAGLWPTVGNPGADTPGRYFGGAAADVIVIHEGAAWPAEARLKGDYFGGYADYPPFTRGVLVHSQPKLDRARLRMVRRYVRWVYVTDASDKRGAGAAANPWDRLSGHLVELFEQLSQ
jgi:hypothetical protein